MGRNVFVMLDLTDPGPDYQLLWPRELFVTELRAVLAQESPNSEDVRLVLIEAFAGSAPCDDLNQAGWDDLPKSVEGWWDGGMGSPQHAFVQLLLNNAHQLPDYRAPRPYWAARHGRTMTLTEVSEPDPRQFRREWLTLVNEFQERGYLDKVSPSSLVHHPYVTDLGWIGDAPEVLPGHRPARLTRSMSSMRSARPGGYPGRADRRQG